VKKHFSHKGCHIQEIIYLKTFGSPATLHAVTKELARLHLIKVSVDPADNRMKNVLPTSLALQSLSALVGIF
jgi:RNA-binding protein YhbY